MKAKEKEGRLLKRLLSVQFLFSIIALLVWITPGILQNDSSRIGSFPKFSLFVISFLIGQAIFLFGIHLVKEPCYMPAAGLGDICKYLLSSVWNGENERDEQIQAEMASQASKLLTLWDRLLFTALCTIATIFAVLPFSSLLPSGNTFENVWWLPPGTLLGLMYALLYLYHREWMLSFPIIQRPLWFRVKERFGDDISSACQWGLAYAMVEEIIFIGRKLFSQVTGERSMQREVACNFLASSLVILCWNFGSHLVEVVYTRRRSFESDEPGKWPNDPLLKALEYERKDAKSIYIHHLAVMDLCYVAESNAESLRREALFTYSAKTYAQVVDVCVANVDSLTERIKAVIDCKKAQRLASHDLRVPESEFEISSTAASEVFGDFFLCSWSARAAATLTAVSSKIDKTGVAQLTGSNGKVMSALLSCLQAVEALTCQTASTGGFFYPLFALLSLPFLKAESSIGATEASKPVQVEAMADVLRNCIYRIVAAFGTEMVVAKVAGPVRRTEEEKWLGREVRPVFGTREGHIAMLRRFIQYEV